MAVQKLRHVLELIMSRAPESRVIVIGDFNGEMERVKGLCRTYGLTQLVEEGVPTHNKGNQLDQCFTNIEGASVKLESSELTDHQIMEV